MRKRRVSRNVYNACTLVERATLRKGYMKRDIAPPPVPAVLIPMNWCPMSDHEQLYDYEWGGALRPVVLLSGKLYSAIVTIGFCYFLFISYNIIYFKYHGRIEKLCKSCIFAWSKIEILNLTEDNK